MGKYLRFVLWLGAFLIGYHAAVLAFAPGLNSVVQDFQHYPILHPRLYRHRRRDENCFRHFGLFLDDWKRLFCEGKNIK